MFLAEFEHFQFFLFSQLFVEIICQESVEKLISCYMVLWIKCLSTSFLFPPSVFHVYRHGSLLGFTFGSDH